METTSRRAQTDWSHVANLPDNCSVQPSGGHLYVIRRAYEYDKESRRSHEKRTTLGQIVDNVFYTCDEYKSKFKRGIIKRTEPRIEDLIYNNKLIENLSKEQIAYLSNTLTSGLVGAVPLLWHIVKNSGLFDDLLATFKTDIVVAKVVSLACYFIISNDNSSRHYEEFAKTHYLPYKESLSSQDISKLYKEIGSHDYFKKRFFVERANRLAKNDTLLSIDSTTISSSSSRYSLTEVGKNKDGTYKKQINLAIIFNNSTHEPICYRTVPGNAPDCRTLLEILTDLSHLGIIQKCIAALDRGYCNIDNIGMAQDMGLRCCMALTLHSSWSYEVVDNVLPELDMQENMLRGGEVSGVTVQTCVSDNSGQNRKFWVHVFKSKRVEASVISTFYEEIEEFERLWLSKKGKVKVLLKRNEIKYFTYDKNDTEIPLMRNMLEINKHLIYAGCFATMTTYECTAQECFDVYDLRSDIERVFRSGKKDINLDVLRTHGTLASEGKTLISFIALTILEYAKRELSKERTKKLKRGKLHVEIPSNHYDIEDVLSISKSVRFHRRPVSGEIFYLSPSEAQKNVAKAMGCENIYMNGLEY